jgi:hypothetical protein
VLRDNGVAWCDHWWRVITLFFAHACDVAHTLGFMTVVP